MVTNSSNDRLVSDLPAHIFHKLVTHSRAVASPPDAAELRRHILSKLQANNADAGGSIATVREILKISPPTLLRILDPCLTYVECNRFLSRIHRECAVQPLSALEMMRRTQTACKEQNDLPASVIGKIPTGLPTLDTHLHGGLPIGSVAELVGRAGVGKTHLAQQLCVLAAKSGGGAVYIDAEKKLSLPRLREIAFERFFEDQHHVEHQQQQPQRMIPQHAHEQADQLLNNVSVHSLLTTRELLETLDRLDIEITFRNSEAAASKKRGSTANSSTQRLPVRLVVIDSIAAPIRRDFDMMGPSSNTAAHRASALFQIAKKLKQLAYDYLLAVVVVNQVGSGGILSKNPLQRNNALDIRDGEFTASLGTAWQYMVSTRIVLEHEDDPHRLQQEHRAGTSVRMATLAKSLVSRRTKLPFDLTKQGLCEATP